MLSGPIHGMMVETNDYDSPGDPPLVGWVGL